MSEFSDAWLALRKSADGAARDDGLVRRLRLSAGDHCEVLDLGCGTGANLRYLAPLLGALGGGEQHWTCADHDERLLSLLSERTAVWAGRAGYGFRAEGHGFLVQHPRWSCRVRALRTDLAAALDRLPLPPGGLVTASALLDLVSADWLDALLDRCRRARCRLLFALTYDGRWQCQPAHAEDATVMALVNRHQRSDKGFGPALGPEAAAYAELRCLALGYQTQIVASPWRTGPAQVPLQIALIDGWHRAALELAPELRHRIDAWRDARRRYAVQGESRLIVGHRDLVANP